MKKYHHIVLFRLHDDVDDESQHTAVKGLGTLGQDVPGLLEWRIHASIDERKGRIIIEEAVFASRKDFENFRDSTLHSEISEFMQRIADWWIGDYEV